MTIYDSPKSTYSMTTSPEARVRVISDVINLIDPMQTPLLSAIGGLDSASSKFKIRGNGTKIEWMEDSYMPMTNSTSATVASTTVNTTVTFPAGSAGMFKAGQVVLVDSEYMKVASVDTSANTAVFERAYSGSAAAHSANAVFQVVTQLNLEGAAATFDGYLDMLIPYNYTQIFKKGMKVTGTEMVVDEYGYGDVWAYQANKKMPELFREIETTIFHGIRAAGNSTTARSTGGLGTFITGNTTTTTGTLNKTFIDDMAELIMLDGGNPDILVVHPSVARDLKDTIDSSSFVNLTYDNTKLGMNAIATVQTQYGTVRLVEDRWCSKFKSYMLTSSKIGLYTLRPFGWRELGYAGDYNAAEVVGEISLVVANPDAHGVITHTGS